MRHAQAMNPGLYMPMHFPQRDLSVKKGGAAKPSRFPVFPGYVFLEIESGEDVRPYRWALKGVDGFFRVLGLGGRPAPLQGRDLGLVLHFVKKFGPVAGASKVYYGEEQDRRAARPPLRA